VVLECANGTLYPIVVMHVWRDKLEGGVPLEGDGFFISRAGFVIKDLDVGTLPEGYIRNVPLPRVPILQSTSSETRHQVHTIPDYYEGTYVVPTYNSPRSIVERAASSAILSMPCNASHAHKPPSTGGRVW
jgi:hypothetical protein